MWARISSTRSFGGADLGLCLADCSLRRLHRRLLIADVGVGGHRLLELGVGGPKGVDLGGGLRLLAADLLPVLPCALRVDRPGRHGEHRDHQCGDGDAGPVIYSLPDGAGRRSRIGLPGHWALGRHVSRRSLAVEGT